MSVAAWFILAVFYVVLWIFFYLNSRHDLALRRKVAALHRDRDGERTRRLTAEARIAAYVAFLEEARAKLEGEA
jgi:hypothetical protein